MLTDSELTTKGFEILFENLGDVEAAKFISLIIRERFDYTKWQRTFFEDKTVEEISSAAMKLYEDPKESGNG